MASCAGDTERAPAASCGPAERLDDDGRCAYATAIAVIRYAVEAPDSERDYVFGLDASPSLPPSAGATIYISGESSVSFRGAALVATWSVLDPTGEPVEVLRAGASSQSSFLASRRGEYSVALEVHPPGAPELTGSADLHIRVDTWRCAADGLSPPCRAADLVAGGAFHMGSERGAANERPERAVNVGEFALDRFEVSVGRFGQFLDAYAGVGPSEGAGAHPRVQSSGWRAEFDGALPPSRQQLELAFEDCGGTWHSEAPSREALPLNCVSWYEAFAFCIWDGGRLPTEAEWEYAAAGGAEERRYPWGEAEPAPDQAIFGCLFEPGRACEQADLPPGGNAPLGVGRFAQQDLAGSLWEWTLDQYAPYEAGECSDCAVVDGGEGRVFRGGGFRSEDPRELDAAHRLGFVAEQRDPTRGFRCARANPRGG
jgi:formylglycine-generating enzyme